MLHVIDVTVEVTDCMGPVTFLKYPHCFHLHPHPVCPYSLAIAVMSKVTATNTLYLN